MHLVRARNNDQCYADNDKFRLVGVNQQAAVRFENPEEISFEGTYDTIRRGGMDPHVLVCEGLRVEDPQSPPVLCFL